MAQSTEFATHPARARVLAELHARPVVPVRTPTRMLQYAFATNAEASARDRAALARFCEGNGVRPPAPDARYASLAFSGGTLRWESHAEFTTYLWRFDEMPERTAAPFQPPPDQLAGVMHALPQPGPLLVAVDLHLLPQAALPDDPGALFGDGGVVGSVVADGAAAIATDFGTDPRGFVRILVADCGLSAGQAGSLVQRLLEIETYRCFALLGLPEAQTLSPRIGRIERALAEILTQMGASEGYEANKRLLDQLTALAAELEADAVGSLYRFGATRAYREIVTSRLAALNERPLTGVPTWSDFLSRRLDPAMRTCTSTEERQASLSRKLARAAQLLRTRVDLELELQNRTLLAAMNERARTQLRLQQTVEGLSVAAISYYVASLAHLVLEGIHEAGAPIDPSIATAALAPIIVLGMAWLVRRVRRKHAAD
ncbi:DUF3422 family protein [Salinarimonas soli]|uniref:DUF3422 domain-containing protein n=1 Tax=Salinarimonas soli TaxID=1638099 RepID=A0A5B2W0W9_9HYPH|nr:DUF3422 domain-containing protein [Salinarimonas soli]KAA2244057.1 DUF3422 domain-containing protein [Salinarimonas soli]